MAERQTVRIQPPPAQEDKNASYWQRRVTDALNTLPAFSTFSYTSPESNVTATYGTIGVSYSSGNTLLWVKQFGDGNTGWSSLLTFASASTTVLSSSSAFPEQRNAGPISAVEVWYYAGAQLHLTTSGTVATSLADVLIAFPFWVGPRDLDLDTIAFRINVGAASSNARVGIYTNTADGTLYPNALVVDGGSKDTSANATTHTTSISVTLSANSLYWFVFLSNSASTNTLAMASGETWSPLGFAGFAATSGIPHRGWRVAFTFAALPSTFPAGGTVIANTTNATPLIGVRTV